MLLCDSGYVNRVCFVLRSRFGRYRKAQAHPRHTAVRVGSTWARAKNREAEFVFTYKYQGTWCLIHGYQILDGLASSQASVGIHAMLTRGLGSYLVEKKKQRFFFFRRPLFYTRTVGVVLNDFTILLLQKKNVPVWLQVICYQKRKCGFYTGSWCGLCFGGVFFCGGFRSVCWCLRRGGASFVIRCCDL